MCGQVRLAGWWRDGCDFFGGLFRYPVGNGIRFAGVAQVAMGDDGGNLVKRFLGAADAVQLFVSVALVGRNDAGHGGAFQKKCPPLWGGRHIIAHSHSGIEL